jgi:hypothetical protein
MTTRRTPFFIGVIKAYDYIGDPPTHTRARQMEMSLELPKRASLAMVLDLVCEELNVAASLPQAHSKLP